MVLQFLQYVSVAYFLVPFHLVSHPQPFNDPLSRTTRVSWHQKKPSPTHTHKEEEEGFAQTARSIEWKLDKEPFKIVAVFDVI